MLSPSLGKNENGNITPKFMGYNKSSSKKEVHCDKHPSQETRKINNLRLYFKKLEGMKLKISGEMEI